MKSISKLTAEDLRLNFHEVDGFSTTREVTPFKNIIGQKQAEESLDLGLMIEKKGYHIFISGRTGTGKTRYIIKKIEDYAKDRDVPNDWCYVYNFKEENTPMALSFKPGKAVKFKTSLGEFIKGLFKEVPILFNSKNYENEKNMILDKYDEKIINLSQELNNAAEEKGFVFKQSSTGEFLFYPTIEGRQMDSKEYSNLSEEEKEEINKTINQLRHIASEITKEISKLDKQMDEELKLLDDTIAEKIVSKKIEALIQEYADNKKIETYLMALRKDIIENITMFLDIEEDEENKLSEENKLLIELFFRRYEVNVLVSNNKEKGAPVIFADSTEYGSLFGKIEYENKKGNMVTDFTMIRPGSLHLANGGYLLIKAHEILRDQRVWETFKRYIHLETINLENSKNNIDMLPILTLNPEGIPLKVKVILLGSNMIYTLLKERDLDFHKLFKIKAEFDDKFESSKENISELIGFISDYVERHGINHITKEGIKEVLRYSSKLIEHQDYLSSSMGKVLQIVDMADYFAKKEGSDFIDHNHIKEALNKEEAMHGLIQKRLLEMYKERKYIVDLKGSSVGQINGLSVINYGDAVIGQQHKITVTTYAGRKGIVNIEREAEMSGSIHSKGVLILSGFVGELIGQETYLSFNANIVFEQLYSGIEGDSASAAELLALLSSLADISLKQSLAITGSVNQKGEIQPIGGVNSKIEGYFEICSIFGLDGTHGVIIPTTNKNELVLKERVIEAVEKGLFHIYTVSSIEDAFEILCEDEFKEKLSDNIMAEVKKRILKKMDKYNDIIRKSK